MKVFYAVLVILLLAACAPQTQTQVVSPPIVALEKGENHVVNIDLNLLAYPRSVIYVSEGKGQKTRLEFSSPVQIQTMYSYFDMQFAGNGWERGVISYIERLNKYEGVYTRRGERLEVTLRFEDMRYRFETR
jgi:hypothetical protein